ncbi:MAG: ATP-binding cassette domain-containing protein [Silicimonas sp.]|nr:ATP-binding cassette domain-containing protein [Silicimonas sp.]
MADTLDFSVLLTRDALFSLDVAESIPLEGITAIVGPSGGGKTTLLRTLAGLERAEKARIAFRGEPWEEVGVFVQPEARRVGYVFQNNTLFPHLDVAGNIRYGARRREVRSYDAIVDALDLGALMSRSVLGLSGGEIRRVALARCLASNPGVLFLDEPLAGLDAARKSELLPYIGRAVAEAQVPSIYVTHSPDEVTALADRVLGLSGGRLTGWRTPPARLIATVTAVSDGVMRVSIDGASAGQAAELALPLIADVGERVELGLPIDSLLLSAQDPGRSDALVTLPATVVESKGGISLDVFGQTLTLPKAGPYAIGARLWLSVLRVLPRPRLSDSAKNRS